MCEAAPEPPRRQERGEEEQKHQKQLQIYDDRHKRLLQWFLMRKISTQKEVEDFIKSDRESHKDEKFPELSRDLPTCVREMISSINERIGFSAKLEIHSMQCETSSSTSSTSVGLTMFWGITDIGIDEQSVLGTSYTSEDVILLRKIIDLVVKASNNSNDNNEVNERSGGVLKSSIQAILPNLCITSETFEIIWNKFMNDGWIIKINRNDDEVNNNNNRITIGPRGMIEFKPMMERKYGDMILCTICQEITLLPVKCKNEKCPIRMHRECSQRFLHHNPRNPACPQCAHPWSS